MLWKNKNIHICLTLAWVREWGCAGKKQISLVSLWVGFEDVDVLEAEKGQALIAFVRADENLDEWHA